VLKVCTILLCIGRYVIIWKWLHVRITHLVIVVIILVIFVRSFSPLSNRNTCNRRGRYPPDPSHQDPLVTCPPHPHHHRPFHRFLFFLLSFRCISIVSFKTVPMRRGSSFVESIRFFFLFFYWPTCCNCTCSLESVLDLRHFMILKKQ
jgi:hypothetical protein